MLTRQEIELAQIRREMSDYDDLPPSFRKYLSDHPLGVSPIGVKALQKYDEDLVMRFLKAKTELFVD